MKINNKILQIVLIVIIILFGYREYQNYVVKKEIAESYNSVIDFKEAEKGQLKNSLDLQVADNFIMKQNVISEQVAKEQFKKELEGYKDITTYMKSEVMTSIKNLEAKYESNTNNQFDGIDMKDDYIHKDIVDKNFLRIPESFEYKDEWTTINGTVLKKSTLIDSIGVFNKFDAIIGSKKSEKSFSWLRKREPVLELKSYNPNTQINYVNNITVDNKKGKVGSVLLSPFAMVAYGFIAATALN